VEEVYSILLSIGILVLGIPIGKLLAKMTKEELSSGKKWFMVLIMVSFVGVIISLIIKNDPLMFTFLFMIVVTSQSIKIKRKK
jgi:FtsH-binding integral membrane protein